MNNSEPQVRALSIEEKRLLLAKNLQEKANKAKFLPLSFGQERLWLDSQLKRDNPLYNIAVTYHLEGFLNVTALEQSLQEIVKRHQTLRTTFSPLAGRDTVPKISTDISFSLPIIDLQDNLANLRQAEAEKLAISESKKTFTLDQGRLWRIQLFRCSDQEHILLVVMHHIISDGWSFYIFCQELQQLYSSFGTTSSLPKLPIQYTDFAQKQREWLSGEVLEKQLAYWQQQLDNNLQSVQLPVQYPPKLLSNEGAYQTFKLSSSLSQALKTLSKQENVTLFMTLMASFNILLNRYTGQQDIVICTPVAGRHRSKTKELIGYFNNILPLRTDLSGNPNFIELISRVRQVALGAYKNQDLPIQRIINLPNLIQTSLTRVLFSLDMKWPPDLSLENIKTEAQSIHTETVNFDLTISIWEQEEEIRGSIEYKTDLFNDQMISQILRDYQALLETLVREPQKSLSDLPSYSRLEQDTARVEEKTVYEAPRSVLELQITKIWEEVLNISPIGVKDNLFVLGASSLSIARLVQKIQQTFAKELPLASIFQSPTIEQVADLLRTNAQSLPISSLAAIQPKGSKPPLFLCEGVGIYSQLIPYLGLDQPLYGLMREFSNNPANFRVEDIANNYRQEMQKIQRKGPYYLGGLSFGGYIAFEIAQQLKSMGEEVALLILFDTPTPNAYTLKPLPSRLWGHINNVFTFGQPYVQAKIDLILKRFQPVTNDVQDSVTIIDSNLIRKFYQASANEYQLKVYSGSITLFALNERKALTDTLFDPALGHVDPLLGWGDLATEGVELHEVSGEHTTMLREPFVRGLGEKLKVCLEKAQSKKN